MGQAGRESTSECAGIGRRAFLQASGIGLGAYGFQALNTVAASPASTAADERSVILLMLVGGPSQLETWDPKPDAPEAIRGPFGSIATSVPGIRISEHLPTIAARMHKLALIRSLHHDQAPIHETGLQLLQTGRFSRAEDHPHLGAIVSEQLGRRSLAPPSVILPGPIGSTGVQLPQGQTAGRLADRHAPSILSPEDVRLPLEPRRWRESYGSSRFGRSCLAARRLVQQGSRLVTVNMYDTVFERVSWDCHGSRSFSTLDDYRRVVLPTFDRVFSALLDDLDAKGMLETTLVAAVGEFGRTPRVNASGGRDHWPGVWSGVMAGGGVQGGCLLGASDSHASEPVDRPVSPSEWLATLGWRLGVDCEADGAEPLRELF